MTCSPQEITLYSQIISWLDLLYSIFLLIFASLGNGLIFTMMSMRTVSANPDNPSRNRHVPFYFKALAVFDTLAVYTLAVPRLLQHKYQIHLQLLSDSACRLLGHFWNYTPGDVAIWLVIVITFDRFVSLWFPVKGRHILGIQAARIICAVFVALAVIKNSVYIIGYTLVEAVDENSTDTVETSPSCKLDPSSLVFRYLSTGVNNIVALIFVSFLPVCLVVLLNLLIFFRWRSHTKRQAAQRQSNRANNNSSDAGNNSTTQIPVVLAISASYFTCLFPFFVYLAMLKYWPEGSCYTVRKFFILYILEMIFYLNHTCNIVFYVVFSKTNQSRLIKLLRLNDLCQKRFSRVGPIMENTNLPNNN